MSAQSRWSRARHNFSTVSKGDPTMGTHPGHYRPNLSKNSEEFPRKGTRIIYLLSRGKHRETPRRREGVISVLLGLLLIVGVVVPISASAAPPRHRPVPATPINQAARVCAKAISNGARDAAIDLVLDHALASKIGEDAAKKVFVVKAGVAGGPTIAKMTIELQYELSNGQPQNAVFSAVRIFSEFMKMSPDNRLQLVGEVGTPGLYCLQAGLWADQQIGLKVGTDLRRYFLEEQRHPGTGLPAGQAGTALPPGNLNGLSPGTPGGRLNLPNGTPCSDGTGVVQNGVCVGV
jgi:hypothetical protein